MTEQKKSAAFELYEKVSAIEKEIKVIRYCKDYLRSRHFELAATELNILLHARKTEIKDLENSK